MKKLEELIMKALGPGYTATIRTVNRSEGPRTGVEIRKEGEAVAPVYYWNPKMTDEQAAAYVLGNYMLTGQKVMDPVREVEHIIRNRDELLAHVQIVCMNRKEREKNFGNVPYHKFCGDIDMIYKIIVRNDFCVTVTDDLAKYHELKELELYRAALKNIKPIVKGISETTGRPLFGDELVFIVKNENAVRFGAGAIASKRTLNLISQEVGPRAFLLPSSVAEWFAVPCIPGLDLDKVIEMVMEINSEMVQPQGLFLSDRVYIVENGRVTASV